jgi:hypothetical protein
MASDRSRNSDNAGPRHALLAPIVDAFRTLVRNPPPGLRLLFGDRQYVAALFSAPAAHLGFEASSRAEGSPLC